MVVVWQGVIVSSIGNGTDTGISTGISTDVSIGAGTGAGTGDGVSTGVSIGNRGNGKKRSPTSQMEVRSMPKVNRLDALFRAARRAIRRGQLMTKGWCACSPKHPVTGFLRKVDGHWVWVCGKCGGTSRPWVTGFHNDELVAICTTIEGGWSALAAWEEW